MCRRGPIASKRRLSPPTKGMLASSIVEHSEPQWLGALDSARQHGVSLIAFVGRELESPEGFDRHANSVFDLVGSERLDGLIVWTSALGVYAGEERVRELCARFEPLPLVSVE